MKQIVYVFAVIFCVCFAVNTYAGDVTNAQVISLVEKTCKDMETDAKGTIAKIANAEHPYKDSKTPSLYVFVYDTSVKIVAHPKKSLIGRSYKGKPDVRGKKFRDDIVNGALANGTGWVDYSYQKPETKGIHKKITYYKLVTGSDGVKYVVCSGKYLE
ncbi:MAG: hypothetical protein GY710_09910 [Desulfobacteraceae bacterium]|nr:hypothetical protein [Desulfobacteraceae bacterium]